MARGVEAAYQDNAPSWKVLLGDFANRERRLGARYDSVLVHVRAARRR
jgi:hypothetical protein